MQNALEKMRIDVATFGMDDGQKQLFEFKGLKGVGADKIAEFEKLAGQLDKLVAELVNITRKLR